MMEKSALELTIDFRDSALDLEDLEYLTQEIFRQIDSLDSFERVERVREKPIGEVKAGSEELGKLVFGVLKTEIPLPNIFPAVKFLFSRFSGKSLKLKAYAHGKYFELEATGSSREEILSVIQELKDFAE